MDCASLFESMSCPEQLCSSAVGVVQYQGTVRSWDPVLGAHVEQRHFTPADEKQAVLMEMYTENRLCLLYTSDAADE